MDFHILLRLPPGLIPAGEDEDEPYVPVDGTPVDFHRLSAFLLSRPRMAFPYRPRPFHPADPMLPQDDGTLHSIGSNRRVSVGRSPYRSPSASSWTASMNRAPVLKPSMKYASGVMPLTYGLPAFCVNIP